jgi:hypothetical protein
MNREGPEEKTHSVRDRAEATPRLCLTVRSLDSGYYIPTTARRPTNSTEYVTSGFALRERSGCPCRSGLMPGKDPMTRMHSVSSSLDTNVIDSSIGLELYLDPERWRWRREDDLR